MRKASSWNTARYHLTAMGRHVAIWFEDLRIAAHDLWRANVVAPEPAWPPYVAPSIEPVEAKPIPLATVTCLYQWGPGAAGICPNGDLADAWMPRATDEACATAILEYLKVPGVVEEVGQ